MHLAYEWRCSIMGLFNRKKTLPELPKPFKKGQIVQAEIVLPGRIGNEKLAVAEERLISVLNCYKEEGTVRLRIKRTKHNIFLGELLN